MSAKTVMRLEAGSSYRDIDLQISVAQQVEKLGCCGIDPEIYGDLVDLTQFASEAIYAANISGLPPKGNLQVSERLICRKPIALEQPLVMSGTIVAVAPHPRGTLMTSAFNFTLPDGSVSLRTQRTSIRLDPNSNGAKIGNKATKKATRANRDISAYAPVGVCQFVPEQVTRYAKESGNSIHYDPDFAAKFGYRAPIAGGLMAARSLMASLCRGGRPPQELDMTIRFKRPMFWDDRLEIMARRDETGTISHLALVNDAQKICIEADIAHIAYQRTSL